MMWLRLKELRKEKGYSQAHVAMKLHVSQTNVSAAEKPKKKYGRLIDKCL